MRGSPDLPQTSGEAEVRASTARQNRPVPQHEPGRQGPIRDRACRRGGDAMSPGRSGTDRERLDPVTFEVIRHRLSAINDEQAMIAARMSGSPVIYEVFDFNAAILTPDGQGLAAGIYIPHHPAPLARGREHE